MNKFLLLLFCAVYSSSMVCMGSLSNIDKHKTLGELQAEAEAKTGSEAALLRAGIRWYFREFDNIRTLIEDIEKQDPKPHQFQFLSQQRLPEATKLTPQEILAWKSSIDQALVGSSSPAVEREVSKELSRIENAAVYGCFQ